MSKLRVVVFMGSARNEPAPWGGPARLGSRVLAFVQSQLAKREYQVTTFDPLEIELPLLQKPHFYYKAGTAPEVLEDMSNKIAEADGFIIVSPEYNHSIPPALSNLMDYFGGSKYSYKPSAIVTYSGGSWGGVRAGVHLREFCGELGCISVSAQLNIATAQNEFNEAGVPNNPEQWERRADHVLKQFEWMAQAMRNHRDAVGVPK